MTARDTQYEINKKIEDIKYNDYLWNRGDSQKYSDMRGFVYQ